MKTKLGALCAATALCLTTALAAPSHAAAATIGVSMAYFDDNFLTSVRTAMRDEATKKGATIQFEDAQGDVGKQLSQIQNFIAQHVDALIVNAADPSATPKMTRLATAAHIPLVYVNREPGDKTLPARVVFVGSDEHQSGTMEAEEMAKRMNYKGNIVIMQGELSNNSTVLRTQDVVDVVAKHPGMKVISTQSANWQRNPAIDLMNNWIVSGDKIDGIAANNDEMAIGAIIALQQAHKDPKAVVIGGVDATADGLTEIGRGNLAVTVFQNAKGQGGGAVDAALTLAAGGTVPSTILVPFELVTKANYKSYLSR